MSKVNQVSSYNLLPHNILHDKEEGVEPPVGFGWEDHKQCKSYALIPPLEKSQTYLIWIMEEDGGATFQILVEVLEPPSNLIIDGTFEDEVLLRLGLS
jgi:hypothetical protein